jgi:hypothetical protein
MNIFSTMVILGNLLNIYKRHKDCYVANNFLLCNVLCINCLFTQSRLLCQNKNIWFVGAPSKHAAIPNASHPKLVTWTGKPTRQALS